MDRGNVNFRASAPIYGPAPRELRSVELPRPIRITINIQVLHSNHIRSNRLSLPLLLHIFYNYIFSRTMSPKLHQKPPFRAEHLGSLLRPDDLLKTRAAVDNKEASVKELTSIEDEAVQKIVKTQLDLGFHPVSDGEYRRHMFW
jgi:hypothetical protein